MISVALFPLGLIAGVWANAVAARLPVSAETGTDEDAVLRRAVRREPLVEIVTGLLFAAAPAVVGVSWVLPAYLWFVGVTVTLTLTDLDRKLIPNRILAPGIQAGFVLLTVGAILDGEPDLMIRAVAGAAGYFGLLFVVALAARGGFGFGDVKLGILLGLFTAYRGWDVVAAAIVLAFMLGGLVSLFLLALRLRGRRDAIPFGPYLVAGAYLALAYGGDLVDWYLG